MHTFLRSWVALDDAFCWQCAAQLNVLFVHMYVRVTPTGKQLYKIRPFEVLYLFCLGEGICVTHPWPNEHQPA